MTPGTDIDRAAIQAEFERERGYWRPWTATLLREHPNWVRAYARYAGHAARHGPLSERLVDALDRLQRGDDAGMEEAA